MRRRSIAAGHAEHRQAWAAMAAKWEALADEIEGLETEVLRVPRFSSSDR